jgi:hypothetical protein
MGNNDWHFFPWTIQYIVGGTLALVISFHLLLKNRKNKTYQAFFLFGLSTALWQFLVYLHRSAPTDSLSGLFFRFGLSFTLVSLPALILTLLYFEREKLVYLLILLPGFLVGTITVLAAPFEIIWAGANLGWSYKFRLYYMIWFYSTQIAYSLVVLLIGYGLAVKSSRSFIRRKYVIVLLSFGIFYFGGVALTNLVLYLNPNFPPFGGVLMTLQFLFIAYALYLPTEKIEHFSKLKEPTTKLLQAYLQMLSKPQTLIPGKELGVNALRFDECLEAMGLSDVVYPDKCQKLVFDSEKFAEEDISEIPDSVLRTLKQIPKAKEVSQQFSNAFVRTYEILKLESKSNADKWFDRMMHTHGGFLSEYGVLDAISQVNRVPEILRRLMPGRVYLFKEEKPVQAYKKLKEASNYGFVHLCISKLHPQKLREEYGVGKASIFWLTFKKAEKTISPKDFVKLKRTISEFVKKPGASIVLLDCFDQIKFANGLRKSLTTLKDFRNLCNESNSIILISINPEIFEKQELAAIEKELEEVKIE